MNKAFLFLFWLNFISTQVMAISTIETGLTEFKSVFFISRSNNEDDNEVSPIEEQLFMLLNATLASSINFDSYKSNLERALKLIESEPDHCTYNVLKSAQREQKMIFSAYPSSIFPERKILFIDPKFNYLPQTVSIDELIKEHSVGLVPAYYGETLTAEDRLNPNLIFISGLENHNQLVHMLLKKRFDFIFDYRATALDFLNGQKTTLYSRNISDVGVYQAGFFVCSRSELGQYVISKINALFKTDPFKLFIKKFHFEAFDHAQAQEALDIYQRDFNLQITPTKSSEETK